MAKFNAIHGIKCGVTGLAKEVHRCRRTVQKHLNEAKIFDLVKEIGKGRKGKKYFQVTPKVMDWYRAGASEKLFITLLELPGNCTPKCPEIAHLYNISSSFYRRDMKGEAAPPFQVHNEQKEKKAKKERLSFEQVAENMLKEGVDPFLVEKVCEAVRVSKTPIASPESWMRKVLENLKRQSELKYARIREKYAPNLSAFKDHASDMLAYCSNKVIWKWFGQKVYVTRKGDNERRTFTINTPQNLTQLRNWIGAY